LSKSTRRKPDFDDDRFEAGMLAIVVAALIITLLLIVLG
jgi:hypothetical protein